MGEVGTAVGGFVGSIFSGLGQAFGGGESQVSRLTPRQPRPVETPTPDTLTTEAQLELRRQRQTAGRTTGRQGTILTPPRQESTVLGVSTPQPRTLLGL